MKQPQSIETAWRNSKTAGNNFDALRLAAAAAVIVSHGFEVAGGPDARDPLFTLTQGDSSLGRVAVMTFFVLSGFLLAKSWAAQPELFAFARKRAVRIMPALAAVVLVSVFVIGPAVTDGLIADYAAAPETRAYLANLFFYTGFQSLPGVFADLPYAEVVNGPLWTLKFEVACYLTLAAFGAARALRLRVAVAFVIACYGAVFAFGDGPHAGFAYYASKFVDLARPFFAGVLFALAAPRVVLSGRTAVAAAGALALSAYAGMLSEVFPLVGGYLVLWAGFAKAGPLRAAGRYGDFSYGLYLWGWPSQQIVQSLAAPAHWELNVALALPLALAFAALSWFLVEKPALAFKSRSSCPLLQDQHQRQAAASPLPSPVPTQSNRGH